MDEERSAGMDDERGAGMDDERGAGMDDERGASADGVAWSDAITPELVRALREQFALDWYGTHGVAHWIRVRENGLRIAAAATGVDSTVVELFAFLHDAKRRDEGGDRGHGRRAAAFAGALRGREFELDDGALALLATACAGHSDGLLSADPTVGACWDADRLDLGRTGKRPRGELLSTAAARDPALIAWAHARSKRHWQD